ncbi:hypothetical protein I5168_04995 [Nonlabens sp. SCSIO 43208]|uniref:hypothetical protein n=1 Tax=Nonlabens sp. SCSIO 43208 TaxID=2793009 RepID=UPI003D6AF373
MRKIVALDVLFFAGFLFLINSCQQDDFLEESNEKTIKFPKLSGEIVPFEKLAQQPKLTKKLTKLSTGITAKSSNSSIRIDTSYIKMIETDLYKSYTFQIVQDSLEKERVLKNYVLTVVNDTTLIQHLVEYDVLSEDVYDMDNIKLNRVTGDDLIPNNFKCGGVDVIWYTYTTCYEVECSGISHHSVGEACPIADGTQSGTAAYIKCVTTWASISIAEEPCGNSGGGGSSGGNNQIGGGGQTGTGNPPGGNNTNNPPNTDPNDDPDDTLFLGVDPNDGPPLIIDEDGSSRKRLKDVWNDPVVQNQINRLIPLIDSQNSGNYEEDGARFSYQPGSPTTFRLPDRKFGNRISYNTPMQEGENVDMHVHQTEGAHGSQIKETYPIFSNGDVIGFAENTKDAEAVNDTDFAEDYISIVLTEKGAFALTVDDIEDVKAFEVAMQDPVQKAQFYEDFNLEIYARATNDNDVIENLADFLEDYRVNNRPLGISIWEASFNSEGTLNKWNKI